MKAEALNLRVLMVCSIQENFKKVTESAIVKCVQKKYSSYIITVSLKINCSKALVILPWFLLLFLLSLLIVYISLVFHFEGFQSE